ncbi:MAG TPA: response regulator transcription factor [Gaiellaceae bacterium]|nr:response regulator transcription factor [Gaiellaceae bacterium]
MPGASVLVVDDDADVRTLVCELLARAGYAVSEAPNGREALRLLSDERPDLIVLDVSMPELDGWETLERIRELSTVPVVMLSALGAELEKVRALRGGADDYVTKPFGRQELLARVETVLRRAPSREVRETYADELLEVDFSQRRVRANGVDVELTPLELRLLTAFVDHPGQLLEHDQLLELAWGGERGSSRDQVKLYVGYLRRKLGAAGVPPDAIESVRGFGYRYAGGSS